MGNRNAIRVRHHIRQAQRDEGTITGIGLRANRFAVFSLMYPKLSALDKMRFPNAKRLLPLSWEMKILKKELEKREEDAHAYMKKMQQKAIETARKMNEQKED